MIELVGNLACEREWRGQGPVPGHVATRIAALATLMRGLVEGDAATVWTAAAIDPARIPAIDELPRLRLAVGVPPSGAIGLAWGATAAVALAPPPLAAITSVLEPALRAALTAPAATVEVARTVNDRRLVRELDPTLPGGALTGAIDDAVLAAAAAASPTREWIAKAALTSAGRDRVRGTAPIDGPTRARLARLLADGPVVVEPWLHRVSELGVPIAIAADGAVAVLAPHGLITDARGGFRGIDLAPPALADADRAQLADAALATGRAIAARGYRGVATIDAFVHRDRDGRHQLRPVVEINARLGFGVIARALCARLGRAGLRVGSEPPAPDARVLVAPTADDPSAAWLI